MVGGLKTSGRPAQQLLMHEVAVWNAAIPGLRQMLTLVVRGERFCADRCSFMIEHGRVRRLRERRVELENVVY